MGCSRIKFSRAKTNRKIKKRVKQSISNREEEKYKHDIVRTRFRSLQIFGRVIYKFSTPIKLNWSGIFPTFQYFIRCTYVRTSDGSLLLDELLDIELMVLEDERVGHDGHDGQENADTAKDGGPGPWLEAEAAGLHEDHLALLAG